MSNRDERQLLGVEKWIKAGCKATLQWCTGVGKTRAGFIAIDRFLAKNPGKHIVIIVPSEYLKGQWVKQLTDRGLVFNIEVKIINSAVKEKFFCDFLILDEVHMYAAESFYKIFEVCRPIMILGLTATFERLDGKQELLAKYCPICDIITVKEATENGWLSPYKEYKIMIDVDLTEYNTVHLSFMDHFAFFDYDFETAMACMAGIIQNGRVIKTSKQCIAAYAKFIQPDPRFEKETKAETAAHAFAWGRALKARKEFVKNHPRKIELAELILDHRKNCKAITFNSTIAQCEKFKTGMVVHSGKTKKKNKITMEEFCDLPYGVVHTSKVLNAGADIPGLNLAIILSNSSSPTERIQRIGRIIRKEEGKQAEVFSLVLRNTMEENWFKKSSVGLSHIELNENELINILTGQPIYKQEIVQEAQQFLFTF